MNVTSKKIVAISVGDIYDRKGIFNAALARTKHLSMVLGSPIELILISPYDTLFARKLKHTKKTDRPSELYIDSVRIRILWIPFTVIDYILRVKLHKDTIIEKFYLNKIDNIVQDYDFIIAHSLQAGEIAMRSKAKWGIPYSVTWHGSDIHHLPLINPSRKFRTARVIESADINFFVSKTLKEQSEKITEKGRKEVLYNAANEHFYKYSPQKVEQLRTKFGLHEEKVVTFAGNFIEIKNILIIPEIFKYIYEADNNTIFWMLGDGKYRRHIESLTSKLPIKFWGNVLPESVPDYINCTDVQILPSKKEGLPLTMVECLQCGRHAVGSNAGGIWEVIGKENCIPLESNQFAQDVANRVLFFLHEGKDYEQKLPAYFDWNETAKKEFEITNLIISKKEDINKNY